MISPKHIYKYKLHSQAATTSTVLLSQLSTSVLCLLPNKLTINKIQIKTAFTKKVDIMAG